MLNISKLSKTFLFLTALSLSIWFGSNVTKLFLAYNLFQGYEFALNPRFAKPDTLAFVIPVLAPAFLTSLISYALFLFFFAAFLFSARLPIRNHGWLFIGLAITVLSIPLEFYLAYKVDKPLLEMAFWGIPNGNYMLNLIIERFKLLSSYPLISVLINVSLIYLLVFQPMKKKNEA